MFFFYEVFGLKTWYGSISALKNTGDYVPPALTSSSVHFARAHTHTHTHTHCFFVTLRTNKAYVPGRHLPFKYEAQTALFKDPVLTAQ